MARGEPVRHHSGDAGTHRLAEQRAWPHTQRCVDDSLHGSPTPTACTKSTIASKTNAKLISKMGGAYELMLDKTTGGLRLAFRDLANQLKIRNSTAALPVADGARLQVRGSLDVDNGAGGHTVTFYYRTNTTLGLSDNSGWTQLGSPITFASTTNIKSDGTSLALGSSPGGGSSFWSGSYYQAQILNGTTVAANPDFRTTGQLVSTPPDFSQWRDTPGNTYTINGTAWSYNPG